MKYDADRDDVLPEVMPGVRLASHFQPIYSLTHNRVVGHEALLRARDSATDQAIAPLDLFARCADGDELIRLDRAARRQHLVAHTGTAADQWLFLNALPSSFSSRGSWNAEDTARDLARHGLRPEQVVIEVLEASLPNDPDFDRHVGQLRALGCLVSLDDFGAGHSNFDRVFRLRPEIVKLDRSVVVRAEVDPHAQRIASQMVSLLHECGCLVLMEGIETAAGAYTALRCDVDLVQGYHFGRPAPDLAASAQGQAALRAAWERFDHLSTDEDRAWQRQMAPYRQSIELASVLLAGGAGLAGACERFLGLPGAQMCYLLDRRGKQVVENAYAPGLSEQLLGGEARFAPLHETRDARWSRRPYFRRASRYPHTAQVTRPYLALQGGRMCVTVSIQFERRGEPLVLCADANVFDPPAGT